MTSTGPGGALKSLEKFEFRQVLSLKSEGQQLVLLGRIEGKTALAILSRPAWSKDEDTARALASGALSLLPVWANDIYAGYTSGAVTEPKVVDALAARVDIICPATGKHISKHMPQTPVVLPETPEMYERLHKGYVETLPPSSTAWVDNILNGSAEADRVLARTDQWVLLPDAKWDGVTISSLYCVAIVADPEFRSLRDCNGQRLALLEELEREIPKAICAKYPELSPQRLRMYFHYPPSYYRLHVHVQVADVTGPGVIAGRAHLLGDVIANLRLMPDYYSKVTLQMAMGSGHPLYPGHATMAGQPVIPEVDFPQLD